MILPALTGNRGVLHDADGQIVRRAQSRRWICELQFGGRHRQVMAPRRYTHLFFLDEATVLTAGHVSMLGEQANWVRNVHAADRDAVLLHGRRRPVHLVEVPPGQRAPIIRRYLMVAWGARPHMSVTWHSRLREVATVAADYPVFRVDRRQ